MKLVHYPCNLCGCDDYSIKLRIPSRLYLPDKLNSLTWVGWDPPEHWTIVQCNRCGLIYTNPRIRAEELHRLYPPTLFWDEETGRIRKKSSQKWRNQLNAVQKFSPVGRLLDVGCANGFLLREARLAGYEVFGVELSEQAVKYAREVLSLSNVHQGNLVEAAHPENFFDMVTMFDVLEHVAAPLQDLKEVGRVLRPGGVLVAQLPSVDSLGFRLFGALWCYTQPPTHLTYFGQQTIRAMFEMVGIDVVEVNGPKAKVGLRTEFTRKKILLKYLWQARRGSDHMAAHLKPNPFETIQFGGPQDLMVVVGRKRV